MVESTANGPKTPATQPDWDQIKKELIEQAESIMKGWDGYTLQTEDKAKGLEARTFPQTDGLTGLVSKTILKKMNLEHFEELKKNQEYHMKTMNPAMTLFRLPDAGKYKCYHTSIKTPFFMSNRSYISVHYDFTKPDGTEVHIESTKGCECFHQEYAAQIGKDVICEIPLAYSEYTPKEDGLHATGIVTFNLNGKVPNFFKNFTIKQTGGAALILEEYIVDGKIPKMM